MTRNRENMPLVAVKMNTWSVGVRPVNDAAPGQGLREDADFEVEGGDSVVAFDLIVAFDGSI